MTVNKNANMLNVSQKWFLLDSVSNRQLLDSQKWFVPFTFTTADELNFDFGKITTWLKPNDSSSKILRIIK